MKKIIAVFLVFIVSSVFFSNFITAAELKEIDNLTKIEVNAKSCVLIEAKTAKVLYAKTADEQRPFASTTKIMTVLLALESGSLDSQFVVDSEAIKVDGSTMGLTEGDVVTKRTLCYGAMLPSGNDAAGALAVKIIADLGYNVNKDEAFKLFAKMCNERAMEIGMTHTNFITPSGLDDNAYSSAYDMALLAREALKNPEFAEICRTEKKLVEFGNPPFERYLTNTNKLLSQYVGCIGVKTGFTDAAGRCLVSAAERKGTTLICVTLYDPDDWRDHGALYDAAFPQMNTKELQPPTDMSIPIVNMSVDSLPLYTKDVAYISEYKNVAPVITYKLIIPPFVYEIDGETKVGYIEYYNGKLLIAAAAVYCKNTGG